MKTSKANFVETYMHIGAEHMHIKVKLRSGVLDVLQSFLVVGASTADPDGDLVLIELTGDFTNSLDDTLECRSHVGEVGNTSTDEENLTLRVLRLSLIHI